MPQSKTSSKNARINALYAQYGHVVYSRCRRLLSDDAAAEDATQEVFLRALRHIDGIEPSTVVGWLARAATNYCLNLRRDRREELTETGEALERASEDVSERLEHRNLLRALIDRLPEELREVAWLRFGEEQEHAEIAARIGVSRRTVINRLALAHARAQRFAFSEQVRAGVA